MLRSFSAVFAVLALAGASAHAATRQDPQRAHATSYSRSAVRFGQAQQAPQKQRQTDDAQRRAQQNRNNDLAKRQLGLTHERAQKMESPFVRQSRAQVTWDSRGLGMMTHGSTVGQQHSIYERLHTEPQPLRQQLSAMRGGGILSGMLGRRATTLFNAAWTSFSKTDAFHSATADAERRLGERLPGNEPDSVARDQRQELEHAHEAKQQSQLADNSRRREMRRQDAAQRSMFEGLKLN